MISVTEMMIDADASGHVGVRVNLSAKQVTVAWTCGDTRTFAADDLPGVIEAIDLGAAEYEGIAFQSVDRNGSQWAIKINNGRLYADTGLGGRLDGGGTSVEWKELRKALFRGLKQLDNREAVAV